MIQISFAVAGIFLVLSCHRYLQFTSFLGMENYNGISRTESKYIITRKAIAANDARCT